MCKFSIKSFLVAILSFSIFLIFILSNPILAKATVEEIGYTKDNNDKAVYVVNEEAGNVYFFYDSVDHSDKGTVYDWEDTKWKIMRKTKKYSYIIDNSFNNYFPKNCSYCFAHANKIEGISYFNVSETTNMCGMFSSSVLEEIDISNFDSRNVTNMEEMFYDCRFLKKIKGLSNLNTSNVETMSSMFSLCGELKLDRATGSDIDLENFDTGKVKDFTRMFNDCHSIDVINLQNFNTENAVTLDSMFKECHFTSIKVSNFNTKNVTNFDSVFSQNYISEIDISNFNFSNALTMRGMLAYCTILTTVKFPDYVDCPKCKDFSFMFVQCACLKNLDLSNFNVKKIVDADEMFSQCIYLTNINLNNWDFSHIESMLMMFCECPNLLTVCFSDNFLGKPLNANGLFNSCKKIKTIDLSCFDFSHIKQSAEYMAGLRTAFVNCYELETIYMPENTDLTWMNPDVCTNMFFGCKKLVGEKGTKYDAKAIHNEMACIDGHNNKPGYFSHKSVEPKPTPDPIPCPDNYNSDSSISDNTATGDCLALLIGCLILVIGCTGGFIIKRHLDIIK